MKNTVMTGLLLAGLALSISASGCTGGVAAPFQANFEEAVKAAEKGKEAMKDARKRRPAKPGPRGPQAPRLEPNGLPDVS